MKSWSFLIIAAGKGLRLGGCSKQLRILGGQPVWRWSLDVARELFLKGEIAEVILTIPMDGDSLDYPIDEKEVLPIRVVRGGNTRSMSVRNALRAARSSFVLIHDGARPFLSYGLCHRIMGEVNQDTGAIPLLAVSDALKSVELNNAVRSVDRTSIKLTQTPQGFPRGDLLEILDKMPPDQPDEAEPWLASEKKLAVVEGERLNFKITDKGDWHMASSLVSQIPRVVRTGVGFDIHPLVPNRPLVLGGLLVESDLGLDGHSDADIICHSVSDALLGAAGLPDIGMRYPASDPEYKNADSAFLLKDVANEVRSLGWNIEWVDIVLNAQYPRIGVIVDKITASLEDILGRGKNRMVNLKIKSGELIPPVGSADCMTCYCVATLSKKPKGLHNLTFPL